MTHDNERAALEATVACFVGDRVNGVRYADIFNFGPEPRVWDYGDWHHAVMGLELNLASGPASILWTNTFHPYGVDVLREPIVNHLSPGPQGPEIWAVDNHPFWAERLGQPITGASLGWERLDIGAAHRSSDGVQVAEAYSVDVPIGLRLDFVAGPVWFVAAMPQLPDPDRVFVNGDEIMVVFAADKMRRAGFPEDAFVAVDSESDG